MTDSLILILGSTGMLGHQVYYYLKQLKAYKIVDIAYREKLSDDTILVDVTDKKKTDRVIRDIRPDFIINCIGLLINESRTNPARAAYLNAYFPHQLADLAHELKSKLIHISTDCVFSGKKGQYKEGDFIDGKDNYARSKCLGEIINNRDLTLRTSIIGPELKQTGEGLLHWFLNQSGKINGYTHVYWSGVTTLELAKAIKQSIDQNLSGLYHLTNGVRISKFELLKLIQEIFDKRDVEVMPYDNIKSDKSLVDTRKELKMEIGSYEEMLKELKDFMLEHRNIYKRHFSL